MIGTQTTFDGLAVLVNAQTTRTPVRRLLFRRWHNRRIYAERVQKKWNRRFGFTTSYLIPDGDVMRMGGAVVVNPNTLAKLKDMCELNRQEG